MSKQRRRGKTIAQRVVADLEGTCRESYETAERLGISEDKVLSIMTDEGYERCPVCNRWCETGELVDEDGNIVPCEGCRPKRKDDDV